LAQKADDCEFQLPLKDKEIDRLKSDFYNIIKNYEIDNKDKELKLKENIASSGATERFKMDLQNKLNEKERIIRKLKENNKAMKDELKNYKPYSTDIKTTTHLDLKYPISTKANVSDKKKINNKVEKKMNNENNFNIAKINSPKKSNKSNKLDSNRVWKEEHSQRE
jgi:hypothetical protein